jgi:hypothetical protein
MSDMENYVIVGWPEIQELMNEDDFEENSTLLEPNSAMGIGECTYLVDKEWLEALKEE